MSVDQFKETKRNSGETAETNQSKDMGRSRSWSPHKSSLKISGLNMSAVLKTWADMSKINLISFGTSIGDSVSSPSLWNRNSTQRIRSSSYMIPDFVLEEESIIEQFAVNVTPIMNESQLWRCFYIFPELYGDVYSPVVRIRHLEDVAEIMGGVLTRDMISACLSYLSRTPILGDFVYIKLDLSSKHLMNIDVLQHYKYIVYLDLSSNYVSDLTVLSFLPYLQWLSVAFNRLSTVLEYETPQWFLTEVHYKYNSVKKIRDISMFWSITILDLSHNNIKYISGLENLQFLRRLDLSFNHIQRLENLNHLRLLWLDVSYNNISSFEYGTESGLWTLLHLEYLNLNENSLMSMKVLSGCTRLRELHARNNRLSTLLELAVYMRQIRLLTELDLRANPICTAPAYKEVVINTFPRLLRLDAVMLDPVVQRSLRMQMTPDVNAFAVRRLLRLLYIEQLSRAVVSPYVPPADTTEVPLVVIVGYEALGKGALVRRLVSECKDHVEHAWLHTTAPYHYINHYKEMPRKRFDDMLLAGDFLTYGEIDGESYGLSRKEAHNNPGKIKLLAMDLLPALMLKHRGRRPYLLLATTADSSSLLSLQEERKQVRMRLRHMRLSAEAPLEKSTLQVLLSGRILITGILNEILMAFPEEKEQSEFIVTSQCSLLMDSDVRQTVESFAKGFNMLQLLNSCTKMSVDQFKETKRNSGETAETNQSKDMGRSRSWSPHKSSLKISGLNMSAVLKTWADMSKINLISFGTSIGDSVSSPSLWNRNSTQRIRSSSYMIPDFVLEEESIIEQFAVNVTPIMNESQLWRCFYIFPELYGDVYSPVVRIRHLEDVAEIMGGVLTRDMISACLSYLSRTPILGDFVYIKLDLSSKHLMNIDVLQHYKYIVYLDLSSNYVSDLTVLSFLPYLQWLSVAFNRLSTVLEYETPQWFLTEVHYKYNSVKKIRDISMFWSITILDLSHNNIKYISGLENLQFLRRLDLSFNHIQRLENLNHLRLLWLDVSYNNISSFEYGTESGLWTLLHLEYLNLNENSLMSMKVLSGCTRLRELHARNNRLSTLLELAVYMRQIRLLTELDLRANPICTAPAYKEVVINTFPRLLRLDAVMLDPVVQRSLRMQMTPDVNAFAVRRLLRLLYIEQLSRAVVSPYVPPADTTEVPLVVIVGYEALGKGALVRRLVSECKDHVEHAWLHTTAPYHYINHYKEMPRKRFDDMLLAGDFLTYGEIDGESYGLSRKEAHNNPGKIKLLAMDLLPALMLKHRGRRPYLLLATTADSSSLLSLQEERKQVRMRLRHMRLSAEAPLEKSTLQVLLSGRILITGILNEILMAFPEEKEQSEFIVTSQCSLLMDSDVRQTVESFAKGFNMLQLLNSNSSSLEDVCDRAYARNMQNESSLHSLYKESQITDEYCSNRTGQSSIQKSDKDSRYQEKDSRDAEKDSRDAEKDSRDTTQDSRDTEKEPQESQELVKDKSLIKPDKCSDLSHPKSAVDFSRYVSSTWKGLYSTKSSKSVTFTSQDNQQQQQKIVSMHEVHKDLSGELIQPPIPDVATDKKHDMRSISTKMPWPTAPTHVQRTGSGASAKSTDDVDLWLAFLTETGLLQASLPCFESYIGAAPLRHETLDPQLIIEQLGLYSKPSNVTTTTNIRDDYDDVHRNYPGLFWDTVLMDDPDAAFAKVKKILQNIVKSQSTQAPMFEIDFAELDYPSVKKRMKRIQNQLTPERVLF